MQTNREDLEVKKELVEADKFEVGPEVAETFIALVSVGFRSIRSRCY